MEIIEYKNSLDEPMVQIIHEDYIESMTKEQYDERQAAAKDAAN